MGRTCFFLICTKLEFSPTVSLLPRLASLPLFPNQSSNPPVLTVTTSPEATPMSTIHVLHLSRAPALLLRLPERSRSGSPLLQHLPIICPSQHHLAYVPPSPFRSPFTHAHTCALPACPHMHIHLCVPQAPLPATLLHVR